MNRLDCSHRTASGGVRIRLAALALLALPGCEAARPPVAPRDNVSLSTDARRATGLTFVAVSAGGVHTCGVALGGAAYCWGWNFVGQLGNGTTTDSRVPVRVAGGLTFAAVSAGLGVSNIESYTCGLTAVGTAYCWGTNVYGQLGNPAVSQSLVPVAVAGGLTFAAVSAGAYHTCGLTVGGAAYCWGNNYWGQLGNGARDSGSLVPVAVVGGLTFTTLQAGGHHTCGVTPAGTMYCWGINTYGELGVGTNTGPEYCYGSPCSTAPVVVVGGLTFAAVTAGVYHTCGLTVGRPAYCWGANFWGQLGNGTTTDSSMPVVVAAGRSGASLSAGAYHTCGLIPSGSAYCWGAGELGDGSSTGPEFCGGVIPCSTLPVAVVGGHIFAAVTGGGHHTCAVTAAGAAYCWGANGSGQLGINEPVTLRTRPTAVTSP